MKLYLLLSRDFELVSELEKRLQETTGASVKAERFYKNKSDFEDGSVIFVGASDADLKVWLEAMRAKEVTIHILPYSKNPLAQSFFGIYSIEQSLKNFTDPGVFFDFYIACNDEAIFEEAVLVSRQKRHLFSFELTSMQQNIKSVAYKIEGAHEQLFEKKSYSKAAVQILSPSALVELWHPKKKGYIKSDLITIKCDPEAVQLRVDKEERSFEKVELKRVKCRYKIATGYKDLVKSSKDNFKVESLIQDEDLINFYTKKELPLFPIASEQMFAELFTKLKDAAKTNAIYLTLLIISVLMATIGLFQNSAPTIIGAMILAPLMGPIVAASMGVVRFDGALLVPSIKTIALSILLSLGLAAGFTLLFPFHHVTEQMELRTHPTLLDLGVALLSGIAAAYGYANSKVGESLAGVAIAVALVPPLCVAGIGLGWSDLYLFQNAFLLFVTNLIGIAFAAGVMFYLLGFASRKYASAAFVIKFALVLVIVAPLYISTRTMVESERIYQLISQNFSPNVLQVTKLVENNGKIFVYLDIYEQIDLEYLKKKLKRFKNVVLIVTQKKIIDQEGS